MMQQVAATSTELAAKASIGAQKNDSKNPSTGEFSMLFDQQQQSSAMHKPSAAPKPGPSASAAANQNQGNSAKNSNQTDAPVKRDSAEPAKAQSQTSTRDNVDQDPKNNDTAKLGPKSQDKTVTAEAQAKAQDTAQNAPDAQAANKAAIVPADEVPSIEAELAKLQLEAESENMTWVSLLEKIKLQFTGEGEGAQGNTDGSVEYSKEDIVQAITDFIQQQLTAEGQDTANADGSLLADLQNMIAADENALKQLQQYIAQLQSSGETPEDVGQALDNIPELTDEALLSLLASIAEKDNSTALQQIRNQLLVEAQSRALLPEVTAKASSENSLANDLQGTKVADASVVKVLADAATVKTEVAATHKAQEQLVDTATVPAVPIKATENPVKSPELDPLLQASTDKINSMLAKLADKVLPDATPEMKQNFVASLKIGLDEMRAQLQQGHEPGLDLQALVSKAVGEFSAQSNGEQSLSQQKSTPLFDIAQLLASQSSSQSSQSALASAELGAFNDSLHNSIEATKIAQSQSPLLDKLDKAAAALQKNEGLKQVVDKVQLMINQKSLVADIRLDPPELGSMQIRLHIANEQASVSFVVQSQQARDALDQSTPKLKEMLAERGIELGQSSVRQDKGKAGNGEQQPGSDQGQLAQQQDEQLEEGQTQQLHVVNGAVSGIDYFV